MPYQTRPRPARGLLRHIELRRLHGGVPGIPGRLGFGQHLVEGQALVLHPRQDVVTGAVENADNAGHLVRSQALAQCTDDRNPAANGRLVVEIGLRLRGHGKQIRTVLGQQGLVGRHDRLATGQRFKDKVLGDAHAADQLDHQVHGRIVNHRSRIRGEKLRGHFDAPVRRYIQVSNAPQHRTNTKTLSHQVSIVLETLNNTRTDGAKAKETNSYLFHALHPLSRNSIVPVDKPRTIRHAARKTQALRAPRTSLEGDRRRFYLLPITPLPTICAHLR